MILGTTTITKTFRFEAAHRLWLDDRTAEENEQLFGKCSRLHGHSYVMEVVLATQSQTLPYGMVINFDVVAQWVKNNIVENDPLGWDHNFLNELVDFEGVLTTAENIARVALQKIRRALRERLIPLPAGYELGTTVYVSSVTIQETTTGKATANT